MEGMTFQHWNTTAGVTELQKKKKKKQGGRAADDETKSGA